MPKYIIAAVLANGRLRQVCDAAESNKRHAEEVAKKLAAEFYPNPVVPVQDVTFERHAE